MSDKTKLALLIGTLVILSIAILFTPNPNFGVQSFITQVTPVLQDTAFSGGEASPWRMKGNEHLPPFEKGKLLSVTAQNETLRLTQEVSVTGLASAKGLKVSGTMQSTSPLQPTFSFVAEDGTPLISAIIEKRPDFEVLLPYSDKLKELFASKGKVYFSLNLPPKSTWTISKVDVEKLYSN